MSVEPGDPVAILMLASLVRDDMPWLYGVAGATAFGRVQKRDHWVSDTVAGALMGYTIGSLMTEQQSSPTAMRLSVTPQSVVANWAFK